MINKNNSVKPYKIYQPWQRYFNHSESRCVDPTCNGPTIRSYTTTKKHRLKQNIFIYLLRSKRSSGIFRFFTIAQFHSECSYILNITESHNFTLMFGLYFGLFFTSRFDIFAQISHMMLIPGFCKKKKNNVFKCKRFLIF